MFPCPSPVAQALLKPPKPLPFVVSGTTRFSVSSSLNRLFWNCNPLAHDTFPQVLELSSSDNCRRKGRRRVFQRLFLEVNLKQYGGGREGSKDIARSKEFKFSFDGLGLGVACHATLKEGESLAKAHVSSIPLSSAVTGMEGKSLWSKFTQNVNVGGICFSAKVIAKDRHLAIPHMSVPDISWIDWKALRARGFEGVLFDKDNTLTAPYGQNVWPALNDSLEECRAVFGSRIALLSNSAGLYQYDPLGAEAKAVEKRLGISVIRHGQKKPAGNAFAVSNYFGCDPSMLIMVGDRYFTDVVYGNNNGLLTIRPAPLTTQGEPFVVRQVLPRSFETLSGIPNYSQIVFQPNSFISFSTQIHSNSNSTQLPWISIKIHIQKSVIKLWKDLVYPNNDLLADERIGRDIGGLLASPRCFGNKAHVI